jgi:hypothetical protein
LNDRIWLVARAFGYNLRSVCRHIGQKIISWAKPVQNPLKTCFLKAALSPKNEALLAPGLAPSGGIGINSAFTYRAEAVAFNALLC